MKVYTVEELAEKLGTSKNYVYNLRKAGLLKFMKLGRWKVREQDVEEFLEWAVGKDVTDPFNVIELENQQEKSCVDR